MSSTRKTYWAICSHLLLFSPFRHEEQFKSPPFTDTFAIKLQKPGVIDIINRNRSVTEPYADITEQALANLNAELTNLDAFSQQVDDEVQVELTSTANDLLDQENETDSDVLFEESLPLSSYTAPILVSDNELHSKIHLLNQKLRKLLWLQMML